MSLRRSVLVFLLSVIFVASMYASVTSYTIGDVLDKENLKTFAQEEMLEDLLEESCTEECSKITLENCVEVCKDTNRESAKQQLDDEIDKAYGEDMFNTTIGNMLSLLSSSITISVIISLVSGILLFLLAKSPFGKLGGSMLSVGATLIITGLVPNLINLPEEGTISTLTNYIFSAFQGVLFFGIAILVIGIVFLVLQRFVKIKKII